MSKQKRKQTSPQQLKQQEAESKKRFNQKIKEFFTILGQPELFAMLTPELLGKLYLFKISPPIVEFDLNINIEASEIKKVKDALYESLKLYPVTIENEAFELNCYDYLTTGLTIYMHLFYDTTEQLPVAKLIRERINPSIFNLFSEKKIDDTISVFDLVISTGLSKLNGNFYSLTYDWKTVNKNHMATVFTFHEIKNLKTDVAIDGIIRPVYRVGWAVRGQFIPTSVNRDSLGLNPKHYPQEIEVYVQNHALNRLCERIDSIGEGILHMQLHACFLETITIKRHSDKYYIDFKIDNLYKVGYFVASIVDNKLIVKTFLLLTQEGTPEEQKLKQLTGLSRHDIQFLNLDKLSSFFDSTLYSDEKTRALFEEAGFKPILDCVTNYDWKTNKKSTLADRLRKYLVHEDDNPNWHEVAETIKEEELA